MSARLLVVLRSCGNPDYGQPFELPMSPPADVPVDSLSEAVDQAVTYRDRWFLGGGNWHTAEVREAVTGRQVARISYNGRCWEPGPRGTMTPEIDSEIDTAALLGGAS